MTPPDPAALIPDWSASCTMPCDPSAVVASRSILTQILDMWDVHGSVHASVAVLTGVLVEGVVGDHGGPGQIDVKVSVHGDHATISVTDLSGQPAVETDRARDLADQLGARLQYEAATASATVRFAAGERVLLTLLPAAGA